MASIQLQSQRTREVHLRNDVVRPGQLKLQSNFNFNVKFAPDGQRCVATVYQSFEDKSEGSAFSASVTLEGLFLCRDVFSEQDKKQVHLSAYEALFPYLQAAVGQLFAASGIPGFMVKKMDLSASRVVVSEPKRPPTLPIV